MDIDYEKLRSDLEDYFGTAMMSNPMAIINLSDVSRASEEELIKIAYQNGFDINDYIVKKI